MKIDPLWSTWISCTAVTFWPTPARRPVSTLSQTVTDSRSPGLITSAETTPALTSSDPKPRVSI